MVCDSHDMLVQQIFELCQEVAATRTLIVRTMVATTSVIATLMGAVLSLGVI